ncbi:MAG: Metallo-beta-lactamase superfamily protein [Deltaproteobacteria bacterium ADurb.Bin135]|nr:MAG: Metallo-beta-lactamase superfamily protein [Deltaproteobacteria bacterium ADurb.Bin135]HPW35577.1 MBL fold metallo-hydrolase [Syntrophorhabdus sp.]
MAGNEINIPPEPDELEVSVFGPGYGESIVLHLCDDNWVIVDSCINPKVNEPAPLFYLNQLNIDLEQCVKQVIATHWHDDHIRGLGKIVKACPNAKFICSGALRNKYFTQLTIIYKDRTLLGSSGIDEFSEVFLALQERAEEWKNPTLAVADRILWKSSDSKSSIYALSPSDAAIIASEIEFEQFIPSAKQPKKRLLPANLNHTAVVLLAMVQDFSILLGSDLQEVGNPVMGWSVIVDSQLRPQEKASFFKIPHHGSENAHHGRVWEEMLMHQPIAALTPFENGGTCLPTKKDIERICLHTNIAYSTAPVGIKHKVKRDRTVEKTILETARNIRKINVSLGQVRLRMKIGQSPKVDIFGDALSLQDTILS